MTNGMDLSSRLVKDLIATSGSGVISLLTPLLANAKVAVIYASNLLSLVKDEDCL